MSADVESIVDGIVEHLRANINAKLTELAAEKNDGLDVPYVQEDSIHAGERPATDSVPHCEVVATDTEYDNEADEVSGAHSIDVTWLYSGDTEDHVIRTVMRLLKATRRCLWRSVLDGQHEIGPILVGRDDYSDLLRKATGAPLLKGGRVTLRVKSFTSD